MLDHVLLDEKWQNSMVLSGLLVEFQQPASEAIVPLVHGLRVLFR